MKRHIRNIADWRLRQDAADVPATETIRQLMEFEQFMVNTALRGTQAVLAFMMRPTEAPTASPRGNPAHPDAVDYDPTHSWGNRLGYTPS